MDTIEDQTHFILAIEHLAAARLEIVAATPHNENHHEITYITDNITSAMKGIAFRIR